jgi:hypothetical protein
MTRKSIALTALASLIAVSIAAVGAPAGPGGIASAARPPKAPTATPTTAPQPTPTAVPCTDCPEMHVLVMHVAGWTVQGGTKANCRVFIEDGEGNLIDGAAVDIAWSGAVSGTDTKLTMPHPELGQDTPSAVFTSPKGPACKGGNPSVVYTCTVTNVSHRDYTYAPELNNETTDSDDACRL